MTALRNTFTSQDDNVFPLYFKYEGQFQPQPAFISLNIRDGECTADYSSELGNATPVDVWNNLVLRFSVDPLIRATNIHELIESNREAFQAILDGSDIVWDNNCNQVGQFSESAKSEIERLNQALLLASQEESENLITDSSELYNHLEYSSLYPSDGQSVEDFANEIIENAFFEDYALITEMQSAEGMLSYLASMWAEIVYRGDEIPQQVAQYLVERNTCEESKWTEELAAMANGTYNVEDF